MRCARLQMKQAFLLRPRRKTGPIARSMLFRARCGPIGAKLRYRAHRGRTQSGCYRRVELCCCVLATCRTVILTRPQKKGAAIKCILVTAVRKFQADVECISCPVARRDREMILEKLRDCRAARGSSKPSSGGMLHVRPYTLMAARLPICLADALSVLWQIILGSITGAAGEAERLRTRGRDIHLQTRTSRFQLADLPPARKSGTSTANTIAIPLFSDRHGMKGKAQKVAAVGKETSSGRRARPRLLPLPMSTQRIGALAVLKERASIQEDHAACSTRPIEVPNAEGRSRTSGTSRLIEG